jgi:hypothetical protein
MQLKKYLLRTFLDYSTQQLWAMMQGRMIVRYDDGTEEEVSFKDIVYSSYAWEFHRRYRKTPLLPKHLARNVLGKNRMGPSTHLKLLGNAINATHDTYIMDRTQTHVQLDDGEVISVDDFKDRLSELEYRTTNQLYNYAVTGLEEYVVGIDMVHMFEVMTHPRVLQANNALPYKYDEIKAKYRDRNRLMREGQKIINEAHDVVSDTLHNDPSLDNNPLAQAVRSGLVNESQTLQCVSARGYLTDIDSDLFTHPILRGYGHGLRLIHDSGIESRSASKSLLFTKDPLREAEYFSRRLQLVSFNVQNLHHGDCGSEDYMYVTMRDKEVVDDKVKRKSDLKTYQGMFYMDDDGQLRSIKEGDKHLIGRQLKLRTIMHCHHEDPVGACSTCVGELATFVPKGSNLGHAACVTLASKSSQNVMSVKHNDGNSDVDSIILGPEYRHLFKVSADGNAYMLDPSLKDKKPKIVIPGDKAYNLSDIYLPKRVNELPISRVTQLEAVSIETHWGEGDTPPMREIVPVAIGNRLASFTHAMLDHIKRKGANAWTVDAKGFYVIDLEGWDYQDAIMSLPMKHFNMSDHSKELADMLESTVKELELRDKHVSPEAFLQEFHDLVNQKLDVNFAVNAIVVYASMIVSAENNNYSLPKPWTDSGLGVKDITMRMRSLSAEMAHENHHSVLRDPASFIDDNRMPHPFDGLLMPFEMYQHRYGAVPNLEASRQQF